MADIIYGWTAERSGASITVRGKDASGAPAKITRVKFLAAGADTALGPHVVAVKEDGSKAMLLP